MNNTMIKITCHNFTVIIEKKALSLKEDEINFNKEIAMIASDFLTGNSLYIQGIISINKKSAEALVNFSGEFMHLVDTMYIEPEAVKVLSSWKGKELYINNLTALSVLEARDLGFFKGKLIIPKKFYDIIENSY